MHSRVIQTTTVAEGKLGGRGMKRQTGGKRDLRKKAERQILNFF
jgi:hypothetical protein